MQQSKLSKVPAVQRQIENLMLSNNRSESVRRGVDGWRISIYLHRGPHSRERQAELQPDGTADIYRDRFLHNCSEMLGSHRNGVLTNSHTGDTEQSVRRRLYLTNHTALQILNKNMTSYSCP